MRKLAATGRPDEGDALGHAFGAAPGRLTKFEPCRPLRLHRSWLAEWAVDVLGARAVVGEARMEEEEEP